MCDARFNARVALICHMSETRIRSKYRSCSCKDAFLNSNPIVVPAAELERLCAIDSVLRKKAFDEGHSHVIALVPAKRGRRGRHVGDFVAVAPSQLAVNFNAAGKAIRAKRGSLRLVPARRLRRKTCPVGSTLCVPVDSIRVVDDVNPQPSNGTTRKRLLGGDRPIVESPPASSSLRQVRRRLRVKTSLKQDA